VSLAFSCSHNSTSVMMAYPSLQNASTSLRDLHCFQTDVSGIKAAYQQQWQQNDSRSPAALCCCCMLRKLLVGSASCLCHCMYPTLLYALGLTPSCAAFGCCCTLLLLCCRQTHGKHACTAAVGMQQPAGKQQQSTNGGMQAHSSKQVRVSGMWAHGDVVQWACMLVQVCNITIFCGRGSLGRLAEEQGSNVCSSVLR
jgi:hypothetical protein